MNLYPEIFVYDNVISEIYKEVHNFPYLLIPGVAQSSCGLWKPKRQRLPGQLPGQLYTYPAKPWLKRKRQYMTNFMLPKKAREGEAVDGEVSNMSMDSSLVSEETRDSTLTQNDSTRVGLASISSFSF